MVLHGILIIGLIAAAVWAVFSADLLRSAIALLFVSVALTLIIFNLNAAFTAVFELSVCAGLITVLFVLAISLIRPRTDTESAERRKIHYHKFYPLPVILALVAAVMWLTRDGWLQAFAFTKVVEKATIGETLWLTRGMDLIGQMTILLVGVYGVVVLFKRGKVNE